MWRWSFLPASLAKYDSVYHLFWARAIRWLAMDGPFLPGQSVSMTQSKMVTEPGQPVAVTVTQREKTDEPLGMHLKVTAPDGQERRVVPVRVPGSLPRFVATVTPEAPGVYQLALESDAGEPVAGVPERRLAVYDRSLEQLDVGARPDVLAAISRATGGEALLGHTPERLLERVKGLSLARQSDPYWEDVFARPLVLGLIVGLLGLEWFLRRRAGWL